MLVKGAAKIAKELGFDYAEAVVSFFLLSKLCNVPEKHQTGFEFRNRRAIPILTGIVIAAENESAFLEVRLFLVGVFA